MRALDKLLGTWSLKHRAFDTGEEWGGQDRFEWMDGGFFLAFYHEEFEQNIMGVMLIGYERKWGEDKPSDELIGHWFESSTGNHFVYIWEVSDDPLTFWLEQKGSDWLILQHAIGQPALRRRCVPLLKAAVAQGEAEPAQAAYLEDRICFFERRPQRYGTQLDWDEHGQMSPWRLEDPARVDEYRRAVGLEPLAARIEQVRKEMGEAAGPRDYRQRQAELVAWAKSVGC